ncbi:MFS transporter [Caballeronia sp. LZ035]|uniref:MFS transporter n=1 Tax=Caballeronia sp. LZ035 TaxID=3038568 RepID=UPI00286030D6|nr:MFS transporter [Caballeronia sp. LZ035]MDR5756318.1 MFS transporter [Caballeronia sp. LZ035]
MQPTERSILAAALDDEHASLHRRISWRLLPMLFLGYVFAYLDRINIGFAALQMKGDLGFTDAVYGLGAGVFFASYFLCEVPSNLLMQKIGARLTMSRIMILWGITSCCMMFVKSPTSFYAVRVLLGVFEAGFAPGVMLYLTFWYPRHRLAQMTALFLSGSTIAGLFGSPLSGWILDSMNGVAGLRGWQWLFLIEGAPTVLLGVLALWLLPDTPHHARWLTPLQQQTVTREVSPGRERDGHGFREALRDPKVYAIAAAWFTIVCGIYAVTFWMPMMLRSAGIATASAIGLWGIVPYGAGAIGMVLLSRNSDRSMERRWHAFFCCLSGAASLTALSFAAQNLPLTLIALSIATITLFAAMPILLSVPMATLPPKAAPGGIALINCIGLTGGFFSPFLLGWVKTATGNLNNGLYLIAVMLVLGAVIIAIVAKPRA